MSQLDRSKLLLLLSFLLLFCFFFFYYLAVWNQYDDTIFSPPSWLQSARNKMPFLKKSMDLAEGRKIATRAMFPDWKGFTLKGGKTSLSAWEGLSPWEAIETVNDLAFCMTQAHVEEKNRAYNNVPPSYDFSKVRQCWILSFMTVKFEVFSATIDMTVFDGHLKTNL